MSNLEYTCHIILYIIIDTKQQLVLFIFRAKYVLSCDWIEKVHFPCIFNYFSTHFETIKINLAKTWERMG